MVKTALFMLAGQWAAPEFVTCEWEHTQMFKGAGAHRAGTLKLILILKDASLGMFLMRN